MRSGVRGNLSHTEGEPARSAAAEGRIRLRVRRQEGPDSLGYWEEFELPYTRGHNVLSALMEIRKNPVDLHGRPVSQIVWEANCLEEVCGACSMVINGKACQACTALVDKLEQPIVIEPLSKFPVIRDLAVDRTRLFDGFKRVRAWIETDGSNALGPGPRQSPQLAYERYRMSACIACGVCLQVCPEVNPDSKFIGPAAINQARLMNAHPTGGTQAGPRTDALMGPGGIADCGNAQNCVVACPKGIPLTESIAEMGRQASVRGLKKLFGF